MLVMMSWIDWSGGDVSDDVLNWFVIMKEGYKFVLFEDEVLK
jgi:hypothetical protein